MSVRNAFLLALAGLLLAMPISSFARQADTSSIESAIMKVNDELVKAHLSADTAALDSILTDTFTHTHSSGIVQTKEEFLKQLKPYRTFEINDSVIRVVNPTTAVLTGHALLNGSQDTFLEVWVLDKGAWRCAAWSTTPLPKKAMAPPAQ